MEKVPGELLYRRRNGINGPAVVNADETTIPGEGHFEEDIVAGGSKPPELRRANLTVDQMRAALPRLRALISELQAVHVAQIDRPGDPTLSGLEEKTNITLTDILGAATDEYLRFGRITLLDLPLGRGKPLRSDDIRAGYADGIGRATASLSALVDLLEEKLDEEQHRPEQQRAAEENLQAEERQRAEQQRRAEKERRAEEQQRAEEPRRAEEQQRAEKQERDTDHGVTTGPRRTFGDLDLHPEIARATAKLFEEGLHAKAVEAACKALEGLVRLRAGRHDEGGKTLMMGVFSPQEPVLRFSALETESDRSEQEGLMLLFAGTMLALRDPGAYGPQEDGADHALEYIALASLLAKILDRAERNQ